MLSGMPHTNTVRSLSLDRRAETRLLTGCGLHRDPAFGLRNASRRSLVTFMNTSSAAHVFPIGAVPGSRQPCTRSVGLARIAPAARHVRGGLGHSCDRAIVEVA